MKISLYKASKDWNIARSTIYNKINSGELSRNPDKSVDTAEMVRVFGEPRKKGHTEENNTPDVEIELIKQRLQFEQERRCYAENQVKQLEQQNENLLKTLDKLSDTVKLLEAPKKPSLLARWFGKS